MSSLLRLVAAWKTGYQKSMIMASASVVSWCSCCSRNKLRVGTHSKNKAAQDNEALTHQTIRDGKTKIRNLLFVNAANQERSTSRWPYMAMLSLYLWTGKSSPPASSKNNSWACKVGLSPVSAGGGSRGWVGIYSECRIEILFFLNYCHFTPATSIAPPHSENVILYSTLKLPCVIVHDVFQQLIRLSELKSVYKATEQVRVAIDHTGRPWEHFLYISL